MSTLYSQHSYYLFLPISPIVNKAKCIVASSDDIVYTEINNRLNNLKVRPSGNVRILAISFKY